MIDSVSNIKLHEGWITLDCYMRHHRLMRIERRHLAMEIVQAVEAMHARGEVHCRLNPSSILVSPDGLNVYITPPDNGYSHDEPTVDVCSLGSILKLLRGGFAHRMAAHRAMHHDASLRPADAHELYLLIDRYRQLIRLTTVTVVMLLIVTVAYFILKAH